MQMGRRRVLGLLPLAGVAACSNDASRDGATSTPSEWPPEVTVDRVPGASGAADMTRVRYETARLKPAELEPSGKTMQSFAAKLWGALPGTDSNLAVSPFSLAAVLDVVGMGAAGELLKQYEQVLGGNLDSVATQLTAVEGAVDKAAADGAQSAKTKEKPKESTPGWRAVNQLFLDRQVTFKAEFLRRAYAGLGASAHQVDFATDPNGVRKAINAFVAEQTNNLIKELLEKGAIDRDTVLVALNTLWLKFSWENKPGELEGGIPFKKKDGQVNVPAILLEESGRYATGSGWKSATVPLIGRRMGVTFVLPDRWPEKLTAEVISAACGASAAEVVVTAPTFKVVGFPTLSDVLPEMGLTKAFDSDYTEFAGGRLRLSAALQKCVVSLDENGIEAAAATAAVVAVSAENGPPKELVLDRPFWFIVHDLESNAPLFVGSVADPSQQGSL